MNVNTYFDPESALKYHMSGHPGWSAASAQNMLQDDGFCECCAVDYTGLDRDDISEEDPTGPLEPHPWTPGLDGHDPAEAAGRVDFDDDEGRTIATVRITHTGRGYTVHIDQLSDTDNLIIIHSNY